MEIITFIKKWTLPCSMIFGACIYLLFSEISFLIPIGDTAGPFLVGSMPYLIFVMLYVTFCKIRLHDLKLNTWHIWLQLSRIAMAILLILIMTETDGATKLILEGVFACIMCPTAAAAAVITEKLGGSIASMTVYTLIDNGMTALLIPLFFPLVEKEADITFATSFLIILGRVATVLILPFCCAMATRKWLPAIAEKIKTMKNLAFYIWGFNLSIVMGLTIHNILNASVSGLTMTMLLLLPLGVTFILFGMGKSIGRRYNDSISAGQALGQKNTIVGIWLTITYLNPLASIAPCAYVIWQNSLNAWQLWYKEKYGTLKW